jgi:hypothetical protein
MDEFYMYVSIFALVVLILVLVVMGIMMARLKTTDQFPPYQNTCPDYWDISSNPIYCGVPSGGNAINKGEGIKYTNNMLDMDGVVTSNLNLRWATTNSNEKTKLHNMVAGNRNWVRLNGPDAEAAFSSLYPGYSSICAKKKWALANKVVWDGITNFNNCSA